MFEIVSATSDIELCRRLAMYWSGLWTLTVIEHSFFRRSLWRLSPLNFIVTFYDQFVTQSEINLPPDIISVISTAHYVSFRGAN